MAKKQKGNLEDLNLTQPAPLHAKTAGGFNPTKARTHKDNKPYIAHTSVYLQATIHKDVMRALFDEEKDFSQLVENLLQEWLKKRA